MAKYHKKPVVVEALQLRWDTWQEMCDFIGVGPGIAQPRGMTGKDNALRLLIPADKTLHKHDLTVEENEWVIKGIEGEFYPCKDSIFRETYELEEGEDDE